MLDIVGVLNDQDDYAKNRNYWKYLKNKLKKENNEVVSATNQLKLTAPDGKKRLTDVLDNLGVLSLAACFPNTKAARLVDFLPKEYRGKEMLSMRRNFIEYKVAEYFEQTECCLEWVVIFKRVYL